MKPMSKVSDTRHKNDLVLTSVMDGKNESLSGRSWYFAGYLELSMLVGGT